LDKFLSEFSSTGKARYNVESIRAQHFNRGATNAVQTASFVGTSLIVEKELILIGNSTAAMVVPLIDLKSGKIWNLNLGTYYNGTISERNNSLGYTGSTNAELALSNIITRKFHARTFFKEDETDYLGKNPKTFISIGTDSGMDLLVIDWDSSNNRTPIKVWNNVAGGGNNGRFSSWIANSGKLFFGAHDGASGLFVFKVPVWEINADSYLTTYGDTIIGSSIINNYHTSIAPNSRCWKTASGTWRHQLNCGGHESAGTGVCRSIIIDVENVTSEDVLYYNSGGSVGVSGVELYDDLAFGFLSAPTSAITGFLIAKRQRFDNRLLYNSTSWYMYFWRPLHETNNLSTYPVITNLNQPYIFLPAQSTAIVGCPTEPKYFKPRNLLSISTCAKGLQNFYFPKMNQCTHKSTTLSISQLSTKVYYKENLVEG
jgi:hypothetical protein